MRLELRNDNLSVFRKLEIAFCAVGAALALILLLQRWFDVPYWFPFLVAAIASAWVGGRVSGWTAVILSTVACDYFFAAPVYSMAIDPDQIPNFIAFTLAMLAGNWFGAWRKRTDSELQYAHDALASKLEAGDVELEKVSEALRSEMNQRERAEQNHRIAELRWRAVFDNAVIGMALADEQGRIIASNERYRKLLDPQSDDLLGRGLDDQIAEPLRAPLLAQLAELLIGSRDHIEIETDLQTSSGTSWLHIHIALVTATPEFPRFFISFCEDASERKRTEDALHAAHSDLAHASRLTTIGELTASIAHELNQPLSAIVTNGNACLRWLTSEPVKMREAKDTLNWIMRDAKRASDIIARIRGMTRKGETEWALVDFNALVRDCLELMRGELRHAKVQVITELNPQLPGIRGERIQLQQAILNLSLNAIDAMAATMHPRQLTIRSDRQPGDVNGIAIDIADTGCGVDEADIEKLFTSFYTTKPEGTGLGLWISRSIVESHSGKLFAFRNPQHGMTFRLLLPCETLEAHDISFIAGEDFAL